MDVLTAKTVFHAMAAEAATTVLNVKNARIASAASNAETVWPAIHVSGVIRSLPVLLKRESVAKTDLTKIFRLTDTKSRKNLKESE